MNPAGAGTEGSDMGGHHLILGTIEDCLTGEILEDTHDERFRQKLAALLVEERGYEKTEVEGRNRLVVRAGDRRATVPVDFTVTLDGRVGMVVKYGPGSLVTRHRPALAVSRLLTPYQIPVVVVTNGIDADVLDGPGGRVLASGLTAIPDRRRLAQRMSRSDFRHISKKRAALESRIVYCYEVDGACPCDDTVCRLA